MEIINSNSVYQLRIYKLFDRNKKEFYERFRDHALRIMKKYGFNIVKMWQSNNNSVPEFIYLLKWENENVLKKCWEEFMADEEWKNIKDLTHAKYGYMVESIEDRILLDPPIKLSIPTKMTKF